MNGYLSIAHLVLTLDVGGLERLAIELARHQRSRGHDARILCLRHKGQLAAQAEQSGVPVHELGKGSGFSPSVVSRLARELRHFRTDVLHTHNAPVHHYGAAAALFAGVPAIVSTLHGGQAMRGQWRGGNHKARRDERLRRLYCFALPWTGAVIMVAEDTMSHYRRAWNIPEKKSRVILNGINTETFAALPASPGMHLPAVRFGTLGRLVPAKDHLTLIDAFARVIATHPYAELHIAGDGEERSRLEFAIAEKGLERSVRLHGTLHDIPRFLSTLDVFVLSSLCEGLPIALLEAMASGLPVVSTRIADLPSVAPEENVAFYCSPGDAQALALQMTRVMSADMAGMGAAGREVVQRRFSIARTAADYERTYRELLGGRTRRIATSRGVLHG